MEDVTRPFARFLATSRYADIPEPVRHEAKRAILNCLGCALGACRHETVDNAMAAVGPFSGPGQATVWGRSERLDIMHAALVNGVSSHVLDFDDTHAKAVHPSAPVLPAALAIAEWKKFGSMCKSLHPGRAAQSGITAALLAAQGFTSSERALEAPRGFGHVASTKFDPAPILTGLGERYELSLNMYKPYACGLWLHATIDGCVQLRNAHGLKAKDIARRKIRRPASKGNSAFSTPQRWPSSTARPERRNTAMPA